jgi:hypothetical protein
MDIKKVALQMRHHARLSLRSVLSLVADQETIPHPQNTASSSALQENFVNKLHAGKSD